ncbi:CDP-glycerol glycerophosphotransferase family protein [Phycicoccus sp. M110.8]|uniref:CDP-glycerol glycerophosphotransferase family protein n=1 Tax=Phycicoccus sp. M110.8 TaxID=3075433 RepID=UPI0028FD8E72|nr:CDP-glycerol glycerophosphotransferase family protein [Phycicoccus sp. M110.8]MDU0312710.1 CDP-glycerol glycerophosphotransferase family protein [Phycicoccus sp. M110.8]
MATEVAPASEQAPQTRLLADLGMTVESSRATETIPLGRSDQRTAGFARTEVQASRPIPSEHGNLTAFLHDDHGISFVFGATQPLPRSAASLARISRHDGMWRVRVTVDTQSFGVDRAVVVLVARRSGQRIELPTQLLPQDAGHEPSGHRRSLVVAEIRQDLLLGRFDRPEYLDARLVLDLTGFPEPVEVMVRRIAPRARLFLNASIFSDGLHAAELRAYRTFKAGALALELRPMDPDAVTTARSAWLNAKRLRWRSRHRPVWMVGERPETAQDTGLAMYEYLRECHPEIDARYVITADSPDRHRLRDEQGVVELGSRAHVETSLAARRILSSHHADYLLAARGPAFQRAVKARRVFLQHGVMGTKNMVTNYGYDAPGFTAEAFIVSSERERRMICEDFGWPARRVFVTGLSRYDRLFDRRPAPERRVLIMPTWRDWLKNPDAVASSDFLARWSALLSSPEFLGFLKQHDLTADFYLHANMQPYVGLFDLSHVNVIVHGETGIQDLLLRSKLMITDYTSAAIDFAFLDRPVVYYQFDRNRFIGKRPSHFDLDEELPGEIAMTLPEVMEVLTQVAGRDFAISRSARDKASNLIAHRDTGARERIVDAVRRAPRRRLVGPGLRDAFGTARRVSARLRRNPRYKSLRERVRTPALRWAYSLARVLPRSGAIVFESNLGADTGDSPGAIYEAMRAEGIARRALWVVQPDVHAPAGARAVRRLSFPYVWAMGRASVWIGNQNMPSWMRRPSAVAYLQTWHGTPLKRMLHDLDTIVGRDAGYVCRVDQMISEWSMLLSPSPWATERFRSAFRYSGDVIEAGYPRNDVLADERTRERAAAVRKQLGLARSKKVVLYAPTFRDDQAVGKRFTFALPLDVKAMLDQLGEEYELIVRLHPIIRGRVRLPRGVHNGGTRFQMQDLLACADVLITDYSSVMFDYAVLQRPMIFFVPDLEQYRDNLRGFYFDFEREAPGPLVRTTQEVIELLRNGEALHSRGAELEAFRQRFCPLDDGRAAKRVVEELQRRGVL